MEYRTLSGGGGGGGQCYSYPSRDTCIMHVALKISAYSLFEHKAL